HVELGQRHGITTFCMTVSCAAGARGTSSWSGTTSCSDSLITGSKLRSPTARHSGHVELGQRHGYATFSVTVSCASGARSTGSWSGTTFCSTSSGTTNPAARAVRVAFTIPAGGVTRAGPANRLMAAAANQNDNVLCMLHLVSLRVRLDRLD